MIVSGSADRICYANWINGTFLSLKISSNWIYFITSSSSQYTCRCICIKMDAIRNWIKISINQIGCKAWINLNNKRKYTGFIIYFQFKKKGACNLKNKITRLTELTRRKQRTNSQYPVEHDNVRIGFMGLSPTTESYMWKYCDDKIQKKIDILNDVLLRDIIFKNAENYVLPPSHLRIYCRCYWVNIMLSIGSIRSIVVVQPEVLLHVKSIHSKRLSIVRLAECYYTHNLLFVITLNWFAF